MSAHPSTPRELRRLAFQALFQIDAQNGRGIETIGQTLGDDTGLHPDQVQRAYKLALAAWSDRAASDLTMVKLPPTWPAHRQPAVDRSILRLAHYELTRTQEGGVFIINDSVALVKEFSTDKSPAFVNALLGKIYHTARPQEAAQHQRAGHATPSAEPRPSAPAQPHPEG